MDADTRVITAISAVLVFIFSLQLLGEATSALSPLIQSTLRLIVTDNLSALGTGWLGSYFLLNGSTIAAVGLAFLKTGIIDASQYFMVASGSRLGAAFIVTVIGGLEYLHGSNESLADSVSIGILSFLVTYSVYVPATVLGFIFIENFGLDLSGVADATVSGLSILGVFDPVVQLTVTNIGPGIAFVSSFILLFISLKKFDMAFTGLGEQQIRNRYVRFLLSNIWISFFAGALLTLLTFSVSLSLGLIVPLYNQGYIKRAEIIPYIMGANLTTLGDTVLAATVLDTAAGLETLLVLGGSAAIVTFLLMGFYRHYFNVLKYFFDRILTERLFMTGFVVLLALTPVVLILI